MIANSVFANEWLMPSDSSDRDFLQRLVDFSGVSASEVAARAKLAVSTITRPLNHSVPYKLSKSTIDKLKEAFPSFPDWHLAPDTPSDDTAIEYVSVNVLPTYAGMGGGGTGEGETETALVPRALVEDILRGRAGDFLLVNVRGDSMEPDFRHGDQLLVDTRDKSPVQPGPFALWFDDAYVVKNVERISGGEVRVFSSNHKYSTVNMATEETRIIGRPVWFGRRL